jgi:DNA-binding HxlR family transcriptional regulator
MRAQRRHLGARRPVVDARALRDVIFGNWRHFRDLLHGSAERIASNIVSSRLKRPVAAGLLTREEATRGQRAAYSLTAAGIQTRPVMVAMGNRGPRLHALPSS